MGIRLVGGRAIDPGSEFDEVCDVYIEDGLIVGLGRAPRGFRARREIVVEGLVIAPGLVDLGCHLREPGFEHKATIASESRAAVRGGVTLLCATPDTHPILDTPAVAEHIHQRASAARGARVKCIGALTVGLKGEVLAEMHALKAAGCVAISNLERTIEDTAVLKNAMAYAASAGLTIFLHSEDYWLGRQGYMHEGPTSTRLGIPGIPRAAEIIGLYRDLTLIADTGVRAHLCRITTGDALKSIAEARRAQLPVTADTSLINLLYTDEDVGGYDANFHVRPPLRAARDRTALKTGIKRGTLDAISAYHEPHDTDAKAAPFALTEAGASTLDTFLSTLLGLVAEGAFDLRTALRCASLAPNQILGLSGGRLCIHAPADLCVFDPTARWEVSARTLSSQGKNNPLTGISQIGRNQLTMVGGSIVFDALGKKRSA